MLKIEIVADVKFLGNYPTIGGFSGSARTALLSLETTPMLETFKGANG